MIRNIQDRFSDARSGAPVYFTVSAALVLILIASESFVTLDYAVARGFSDMRAYMAAAECTTMQSCAELGAQFQSHHLERGLPHLLVGWLSRTSGLGLSATYMALVFVAIGVSVFAIGASSLEVTSKLCMLTAILFFPYGFRMFLFAPAMITDALFFTMVLLVAIRIMDGGPGGPYAALVLAAVSRQTALLMAPIFWAAGYLGNIRVKAAILMTVALVAFLALNQVLVRQIFDTNPHSTISHMFGLFDFIAGNGNLADAKGFLIRFAMFLLLLAPFAVLNLNPAHWKLAAVAFLSFASQPILAGPSVTGDNIPRLLVYFLPCMIFLLKDMRQDGRTMMAFLALSFLGSLHHNFSIQGDKTVFIALVGASAAAALIVLALRVRGSRDNP